VPQRSHVDPARERGPVRLSRSRSFYQWAPERRSGCGDRTLSTSAEGIGSMRDTLRPSPPRESIRVALAVPGVKVPAWVEAVGRALLGMGFVELTVVVANGASSEAHAGGRWPGGRLWRAYRTLDLRLQRLVCRRSADPSAVVDLDGLGCALVDKPPDELDLLIGAHDPSALRALAARVDAPVWWLDHDGHERWPAAAAGYAEVLSGSPVTRCRLMAVAPGEWEPAVLRTALFATHPLFGAENRVQLLWKSIPLLVQKVSELRDRGEVTCEVREGREGVGVREKPWGGRSGLVCALARHAWRSGAFSLRRLLWRGQWYVAMGERPALSHDVVADGEIDRLAASFRPTRVLMPPADRFWADPHFLPGGADRLVLVQEFLYACHRGRISLLRLNDAGEVAEVRSVIERDCHLSYPAVFEFGDDLYIVPESSELSRVDAYRCTSFPWRWEHARTLLDGLIAYDSSIVEYGGRWWLFAAVMDEPWLTPRDSLHVFFADNPVQGPWRAHAKNPVVCDARSARPAGPPFVCRGRLYRPSQDCSAAYGSAMRINEVTTLTESHFEEREVAFLAPSWCDSAVATHTLGFGRDQIVVDAMRWQRRAGAPARAPRRS